MPTEVVYVAAMLLWGKGERQEAVQSLKHQVAVVGTEQLDKMLYHVYS